MSENPSFYHVSKSLLSEETSLLYHLLPLFHVITSYLSFILTSSLSPIVSPLPYPQISPPTFPSPLQNSL